LLANNENPEVLK